MPADRAFSCLYFPYGDPAPTESVLHAALLFDRVYFLEPNFFRAQQGAASLSPELRAIGCFHEVGPELLGMNRSVAPGRALTDENVQREIHASIRADLSDVALQELSKSAGKVSWFLPNGQYLFWCGLGVLFDLDDPLARDMEEVFSNRETYYEKVLGSWGYVTAVQSYEEARVRAPAGELMVRLPFLLAESLMVTLTLHACRELSLCPFTDTTLHQRFLTTKLQHVVSQLTSSDEARLSDAITFSEFGAATLRIPHVANLTPERVARLRDRCADELGRFREHVAALATDIEQTPWDAAFDAEINRRVRTLVAPALTALEQKLRDLRLDFGLEILGKAAAISPLPFVLNISTGLPIEWALPASLGVVWLKETLAYATSRVRAKRNGLSFLLQLR